MSVISIRLSKFMVGHYMKDDDVVLADFEILAFPSNQFGGQEPGSNEQIKEFACTRFKAEFPLFDKVQE